MKNKIFWLRLFGYVFLSVLRIRIHKIFAFWIRIRENMRIQGSGSKGQIINQKLQKKNQIWTIEKNMKISWFLNGSSSFSIKISEKIWKFCFVKKIQKIKKWPGSSADHKHLHPVTAVTNQIFKCFSTCFYFWMYIISLIFFSYF